jgi:hypothetical protein
VNFMAGVKSEGALGKVFASDTHRKVAYYLGRADEAVTDSVGHGTHVCGSVAGAPLNAVSDVADPGVGMDWSLLQTALGLPAQYFPDSVQIKNKV